VAVERVERIQEEMTRSTDSQGRRLGLALFWVYVALYGGFIALVLVRPDLLSLRPFGGVNLAIASGMGLIAAAFGLALLSLFLRSRGS